MADATDITLETFKLWSTHALRMYLSLRKKNINGNFDELAARWLDCGKFVTGVSGALYRGCQTLEQACDILNTAGVSQSIISTGGIFYNGGEWTSVTDYKNSKTEVLPSGDAQKGGRHHFDTDDMQLQQQFQQLEVTDEEQSKQQLPDQLLTSLRQLHTMHPILASTDQVSPPALPRYSMDRRPRGCCLIINNQDFYEAGSKEKSKTLDCRDGTEKDAEMIEKTFKEMHFVVDRRLNLSDVDMTDFLVDIARKDHSNYDCFVCFILTHGDLDIVYGSNSGTVNIKQLACTYQANRCTSLAGKPKLFFIQACQERDKMKGCPVMNDGPKNETIPIEADFLLACATVSNHTAFRTIDGSFFIQDLCVMLQTYANSEDLLSILVKVNEEVSKKDPVVDGEIFKQMPTLSVTLRKKLFFG